MPAKRKPGVPIPKRSSNHPDRRCLHLNLTAWEYGTIATRARDAGLSMPRYVRKAALGVPILGTKPGTDLLAHVRDAIMCVRALAETTLVRLDANTRRHLEAAIWELYQYAGELDYHIEHIEAAPEPAGSSTRQPARDVSAASEPSQPVRLDRV